MKERDLAHGPGGVRRVGPVLPAGAWLITERPVLIKINDKKRSKKRREKNIILKCGPCGGRHARRKSEEKKKKKKEEEDQ